MPIPADEPILVEHIFGNPPGWITRWGISLVAIFISLFLGFAAIVKYPDKLLGQGYTSSLQAPVDITAPSAGFLLQLNTADKQQVEQGQLLLAIQSTANWQDVLLLDSLLITGTRLLPQGLQLGELEAPFQALQFKLNQKGQRQTHDLSQQKTKVIQAEIKALQDLNKSLERQQLILKQELDNIEQDYKRSVKMLDDGSASTRDVEKAQNALYSQKRQVETLSGNLINNQVRIEQLKTDIINLTAETKLDFANLDIEAQELLQNLKANILAWKQRYLVYAPISGRVVCDLPIASGTYLKQGDIPLKILPTASDSMIIVVKIPKEGAGKLAIGQRAIISLDDYPTNEYGQLEASVKDISLLATEDGYTVKLQLPAAWQTSYGKTILPSQGLALQAQIITSSQTVLKRIFNALLANFDKLKR